MSVQLKDVTTIPGFTYRWPEEDEDFSHGWEADAVFRGRGYRIRLGIGERQVYGRLRAHTVTWVDSVPAVEGVAADDYEESNGLLSVLRHPDKKHIRDLNDVPEDYRGFDLVLHSDEIQARYSRRSIAVKIRHDDLERWALHALLRTTAYGRAPSPSPRTPVEPPEAVAPEPVAECGEVDQAAVVAALLSFGKSQSAETLAVEPSFTPHVEANRLVIDDPFAFLLAVIFDQGIPAERAWEAPYLLKQRLGHLDPHRMAQDSGEVATAVNSPPKLHRYIEKMPAWVVSGARRLVEE
jgi:hypothetical protein